MIHPAENNLSFDLTCNISVSKESKFQIGINLRWLTRTTRINSENFSSKDSCVAAAADDAAGVDSDG